MRRDLRKDGAIMNMHTITMKSHLSKREYDKMSDFLLDVNTRDYGKAYPKNNSILFHHAGGGFQLKLYHGKDAAGYPHYLIYLTLNPYNLLNEMSRINTFVLNEEQIESFCDALNDVLSIFPEGLNDASRYIFDRIDLCTDIRLSPSLMEKYLIFANGAYQPPGVEKNLEISFSGKKALPCKYRVELESKGYKVIAYNKEHQLKAQNICDYDSEDATGILRFELALKFSTLQCLALKWTDGTGVISHKDFLSNLLGCSEELFENAFSKMFFMGTYHTLSYAKEIINGSSYKKSTKEIMISLMKLTAEHRSIQVALRGLKKEYPQMNQRKLLRLFEKFNELKLNPYPIPVRWEMKEMTSIPVLLRMEWDGNFNKEGSDFDGNVHIV